MRAITGERVRLPNCHQQSSSLVTAPLNERRKRHTARGVAISRHNIPLLQLSLRNSTGRLIVNLR